MSGGKITPINAVAAPAQDYQAEKALISELLAGADLPRNFEARDIYGPKTRLLYQVIEGMSCKADFVTVESELEKRGMLDQFEPGELIGLATEAHRLSSGVGSYARIITERAIRRKLDATVHEIKTADTETAIGLMEAAQEDIARRMALSKTDTETALISGSAGYDKIVNWSIRGLLQADSLGMVYGASGSYKSFCVIDWACCIATGTPWGQSKVNDKGPILYIAGEGQAGIAKRVKAWETVNGIKADNFYRAPRAYALTDRSEQQSIIALCDQIAETTGTPVKMIVIDTVNRCFGDGDENSTSDMTAFVAGCDTIRAKTGAAMLCVHHTGKDKDKGARGSSVLRSACDYEYQVSSAPGVMAFTLKCTKAKDFDGSHALDIPLASIELGFKDEDGQQVTSLARGGTPMEAKRKADTISGSLEDLALECIDDNGGEVARLVVRDWLMNNERIKTPGKKDDTYKRSANRAIDSLISSAQINAEGPMLSLSFESIPATGSISEF